MGNNSAITAAAAVRLTLRFPFWTEVFYSMEVKEAPEGSGIQTEATDGRNLWINKKFFTSIPLEQQVAELVHELGHKIYLHPSRRGGRDPQLWNIACVARGTWVRMADGCMRSVEDVRGGEYVRTPAGPARVLLNTKTLKPEVMEVSLSNGCKLTCSLDHKVLTNAGFIEAGSLQEGATVIVDARAGDICSRRVCSDGPTADSGTVGNHVPTGGVDHDPQSAESRGAYHAPGQRPVGRSGELASDDTGLHGGADRRRRNDHGGARHGEGQGVPAPGGMREQHVDSVVALAGELRHAGNGHAQHQRQGILQGDTFRLRDRTVVAWDAAAFDYQEGALRAAAGVYINPQRNEAEVFANAANAADIPGGEGYQHARVTLLRRIAAPQEVFDLTTEKSCYETEGFVSHNCDFAINAMMKTNGFTIPNDWLLDMKYDGWLAERIYEDLKRQQKEGGGSGRGMPQLTAGRADLVEPQFASQEEKERFEQEVQQTVERALAMAKLFGKVPIGMETSLTEAYKPVKEPWYNHLHRYMQSLRASEYDWRRINRRALLTHKVFAPSILSNALGPIVIARDTSGSCFTQAMQANFSGHMNAILAEAKPERIYTVDFDTRAYPGPEYSAGEFEMIQYRGRGGGGTSFIPIFEWIEEQGIVPEVCIILTDLCGTFPREVPDYPVIWASIEDTDDVPFGEVIHVE